MNQLQRLLVVIVFLCCASSLRGRPQAVSATAQANVNPTVETGPVVPSDSMRPYNGGHLAINAEPLRGSALTRTLQGGTSRLCFEPGIGWQSIPISAPVSMEMLNVRSSSMGSVAGRPETKDSASNSGSRSKSARSLGANTAVENGCPTRLTNIPASRAISDVISADRVRSITSVPSTRINSRASKWLDIGSSTNPAGNATSQRHFVSFGSVPIGNNHFAARSTSSISADEVTALKSRAYLSPIKLRRMIRNAPDLQTRIELRELRDRLTKRPHKVSGTARKDKSTRDPSTNEPRYGTRDLYTLTDHGHAN